MDKFGLNLPGGWNEDGVLELMAQAGDLAMETFQKVKVELKADNSLVTQADLAVEKLLSQHLLNPEAGVYMIGEEGVAELNQEELGKAFQGECYIVDPIDGTVNYANGLEMWGVSVGRMVKGKLVDGAVYMPVLSELFLTCEDGVVKYRRVHGKWTSRRVLERPKLVNMEKSLISVTQQMVKETTFKTRASIHAVAVAIYPILKFLEGSYKAYIGNLKLWDIAGVLPMVARLGLEARLLNGTPFGPEMNDEVLCLDIDDQQCFKLKGKVFIGHPGEFEKVLEELAPS
jgi:myo-inositol-1(or 4)-monophosphatase